MFEGQIKLLQILSTRTIFVVYRNTPSFMRRFLLIILMCALAISSSGCKKVRLRAQLKALMNSTVVLPERITCINKGEVYPMPDSLRQKPMLIVYVDSVDCASCRVSKLWVYESLVETLSPYNVEVVILLANVDLEGIPITRYLSDIELSLPVYVDDRNEYLKDNPLVNQDSRFHSLLIDEAGCPSFVGDPLHSNKMMDVFNKALNHLNNSI